MRIKVISLATSVRRRASIRNQFERLDTPFEFFDAITPRDALNHVRGYDENEFLLNCGRPATAAEIACYASHLALWRMSAEEGAPYLILEDDARLDETFLAGLLVAASRIRRLGFIRVSLPTVKTSLTLDQLGPFNIQYCRRVPLLALGYGVSPEAAARLAHAAPTVEEPVDKFIQRFWRHGQPVFAVMPPFVHLTPLAYESDIGHRVQPDYGLNTWLRRAVRKSNNSISRTLYNVGFAIQTLSSRVSA
jgi:glycosyl transferase, family 25